MASQYWPNRIPIFALAVSMIAAPVMTAPSVQAAGVGDQTDSMSASDAAIVDNMDIEDDDPPIYIPPVTGAPGDRIGAGTRGNVQQAGKMVLLAPKGGGLTLSTAPRLHWWLSEAFSGTMEIRIKSADAERPILNLKRVVTAKPGFQAFDMSDFGLQLAAGEVYTWTIRLVGQDGSNLAADTSFIEHKPLGTTEQASDRVGRARSLAETGYWYDALGLLSDDPRMAKLRAGLLKSAGLTLKAIAE